MKPYTLEEFAEELRRKGDYREFEFANDILALIDIEEEVAEPYSDLCGDLEHYAPEGLKENPAKAVEWLGDRSHELDEIRELFSEEELSEHGIADAVKELQGNMTAAEAILEAAGWPGMDFLDALQGLADRAARAPEETEIMTYDL